MISEFQWDHCNHITSCQLNFSWLKKHAKNKGRNWGKKLVPKTATRVWIFSGDGTMSGPQSANTSLQVLYSLWTGDTFFCLRFLFDSLLTLTFTSLLFSSILIFVKIHSKFAKDDMGFCRNKRKCKTMIWVLKKKSNNKKYGRFLQAKRRDFCGFLITVYITVIWWF